MSPVHNIHMSQYIILHVTSQQTSLHLHITEHIDASANPKYGTAFRTVLITTTEPERIWTGNWSFSQIHHLGALLATAQVLPTSPCGLSALASEVLQLSRILSRTALLLWIVKTSIESPILRRRRIAAAEADEDRYHSTTGNTAETSPRHMSSTSVALDEASDTHVPDDSPPPPPPLPTWTVHNHTSTSQTPSQATIANKDESALSLPVPPPLRVYYRSLPSPKLNKPPTEPSSRAIIETR